MIDIEKVKAAFAATTNLCQGSYYKDFVYPGRPAALCAISALCVQAGMHPDLLGRLVQSRHSFENVAFPILSVEYGIPSDVAREIVGVFDNARNPLAGVSQLLNLFEGRNREEAEIRVIPRSPALAYLDAAWESFLQSPAFPMAAPKLLLSGYVTLGTKQNEFVEPPSLAVTAGEVLELAARFLKTEHVQTPDELAIESLIASTSLVSLSVPPDRRIIEHATTFADIEAGRIERQPQLVGSVTEWRE